MNIGLVTSKLKELPQDKVIDAIFAVLEEHIGVVKALVVAGYAIDKVQKTLDSSNGRAAS